MRGGVKVTRDQLARILENLPERTQGVVDVVHIEQDSIFSMTEVEVFFTEGRSYEDLDGPSTAPFCVDVQGKELPPWYERKS